MTFQKLEPSLNWILFGFKGAGKTYYGSRLKLPFIDTDQLVGMAPNEIPIEKFRKLEKKVILSLDPTNTVISVGGGAVLDPENLAHLQKLGALIYLKCPKSILKTRPLPNFVSDFEEMYATRIKIYESIPATVIDLEGKTTQEVLEGLWQAINLETSSASQLGESPTEKP